MLTSLACRESLDSAKLERDLTWFVKVSVLGPSHSAGK